MERRTDKKKKLEEELKRLNKEHKEKKKLLNKSPDYISLEKRKKELEKKTDSLYIKKAEIEENIKLIYLDSEGEPKYKADNWGSRNIRPEVLSSIKRNLGITNLSYLKPYRIEEITKKLINLEEERDKEFKKIEENYYKSESELEKVEHDIETLEKPLEDLDDKKWDVENDLLKIEEEEKNLKNPDKKKRERWKKENKAQKKIQNINFEEMRIEIIKDKIINNLKDEED